MSVLRFRICFWCSRNLVFSFLINTCISYGLSREFNEGVVRKLFIPEKSNISKVNLVQSSSTSPSSKNKINNSNYKYLKNDSRRQRISSSLRLKRNTLLADEDLFEFMVRIANTPAEWERIRRVLSRIKQEDIVQSTLASQLVSSVAPQSDANLPKQTSPSISNVKKWPSSEWIKDMIENATKDEDSYVADDDELDESDLEFADETNRVSLHSGAESEAKNTTNRRLKATNQENKLIPNSDLPNFAYHRVISNSDNPENSAYIAVSVISNRNVNSTTKETGDEVDEPSASRQSALLELETRRRHLKKKIHKT